MKIKHAPGVSDQEKHYHKIQIFRIQLNKALLLVHFDELFLVQLPETLSDGVPKKNKSLQFLSHLMRNCNERHLRKLFYYIFVNSEELICLMVLKKKSWKCKLRVDYLQLSNKFVQKINSFCYFYCN